jgi:predicted nucleic acid-binding protein
VKAYADASVVLRVVLRQPKPLREWGTFEAVFTSALLRAECLRTLDRYVFRGLIDLETAGAHRAEFRRIFNSFDWVGVRQKILSRAADPFPSPLGTLDAIHLATALALRDDGETDFVFATHDTELGAAARAMGFRVVGC